MKRKNYNLPDFLTLSILKFVMIAACLAIINFTVANAGGQKDKPIVIQEESLPDDLPLPIVDIKDNPAPGGIFLAPFGPAASQGGQYKPYLMILDTSCNVVSYELTPEQDKGYIGYHFKEETNGMLSYLIRKMDGIIFLTDTSYNVITSFKDTLNPYNRIRYFAHFDLLPNGHYLTVRYDFQYLDMSKYFPQGEPNGAVLQAVIQELDKDKNVVFQWRSLDYTPVSLSLDNVSPAMDYFHPNSMVLDNDGNLLLCARDLGSILKINRNTGDIIWTLGGKNNDFQFIDEHEENAPTYFSYQHDIRRLPNGNITLFDNGRQHNPQYSRAVEYELDEVNKTCKLVWEYRHDPDIFAEQHGSTQRLPNGNTLIAWGTYSMNGGAAVTEVHPDNTTALEFHFPTGLESQFIYQYPWPACPLIASVQKKEMLMLNTYDFNTTGQRTGISLKFNSLNAFIYNSMIINKYNCSPLNPEFEGRAPVVSPYRFVMLPSDINTMQAEIHLSLDDYPEVFEPGKSQIYFRPAEGSGVFKPLETTFDAENNELVAVTDTTGEFIVGYPDVAVIPADPFLLSPANGEKPDINSPVKFSWSPKGYFTSSQLQVAADTNFTEIITDSTLRYISASLSDFSEGNKYFWRVRTSNDAGSGAWSEIRSFTMSQPYLSMRIPNGGEVWDTTSQIIRWDYNLKDSVDSYFKIELYRDGALAGIIQPSRFSAVNAFKWKIPADTPPDSTYQIKVTSVTHPELSAMSENFFTIKAGITGVEDHDNSGLSLSCSPNPFSNSTLIEYYIPYYSPVNIRIFDVTGNEIAELVNDSKAEGSYKINWMPKGLPSGEYICSLTAGSRKIVKKIIFIR